MIRPEVVTRWGEEGFFGVCKQCGHEEVGDTSDRAWVSIVLHNARGEHDV